MSAGAGAGGGGGAGSAGGGAGGGGASAAGSVGISGAVLKYVGKCIKLGSDIAAIGTAYLDNASQIASISGNIMQSKSNQFSLEMQKKNLEQVAGDAIKQAGRIQEAGRLSREMRLQQLGDDKGRIISGAAGSGIDVSSNTVNKAMADTIRAAYNDTSVMAANEREAVQEKINESESAKQSLIWNEYNTKIEEINQHLMFKQMDLANRSLKYQVWSGALNAVANFIS